MLHHIFLLVLANLLFVVIDGYSVHYAHHRVWAQDKSPKIFDLPTTLLALKHTQGRLDALSYLLTRPRHQLPVIHHPQLIKQLAHIIVDKQSTLQQRTWSITLLERLQIADPSLLQIIKRSQGLKKVTIDTQKELVVARAATSTLRALGRIDLLVGITQHPDPVIRAIVAGAGADPDRLCVLTKDAWREVRLAAILGLAKVLTQDIFCVLPLISRKDTMIALEASKALGKVAQQDWFNSAQHQSVLHTMQKLAKESHLDISVRSALLYSLAQWNHTDYAQKIILTHLEKKGLSVLSVSAARSLGVLNLDTQQRKTTQDLLQQCVKKSHAVEVRLHCTLALVRSNPKPHSSLVDFLHLWADRRGGREQQTMLKYLRMIQPAHAIPSSDKSNQQEQMKDDLVPSVAEEVEAGLW